MRRNIFSMFRPQIWRSNQRGVGALTAIVFGGIFIAVVFVAYNVLPFYYCYFEISNQMEQIISVASTETDQEIREKLMYHIKKLDLPVSPSDLRIERAGGLMRISLPYTEVFYITFRGHDYDLYTFNFHAYAEGRI